MHAGVPEQDYRALPPDYVDDPEDRAAVLASKRSRIAEISRLLEVFEHDAWEDVAADWRGEANKRLGELLDARGDTMADVERRRTFVNTVRWVTETPDRLRKEQADLRREVAASEEENTGE